MNIYLLNPPFSLNGQEIKKFFRCTRWQGGVTRGGTYWYPIWLAYAAGLLEKENHNVRLVDAPAQDWNYNAVLKDIKRFKPEIIVIDSNFASLRNDISVANELKELTGSKTILVGPPASQFPDEILKKGIDIVAKFEYDFTLRNIVDCIENGNNLGEVKGIAYNNEGNIINTPIRPFITSEELDTLPFVSKVYKDHTGIKDYFLTHTLYPMVQIFTGRGCPNQCTFCSWPKTLMGRDYRVRSVENIVDEFEFIIKELPDVREVFIEDDTFTIKKSRIYEFCQEMKNRGLDITWSCNSRVNLDYKTMKMMKNSGCRLLDVGFESGDNRILKNIKKGINTEESLIFMRSARKAGLLVLADFIFGLPGETKETAEKTINFVKKMQPNMVQFAVATPIPGTEFYDWVLDNQYCLIDDLNDSIDENGFQKCIISYPEFTKEDIEFYVNKALKEYYLSFFYIPTALRTILRKNGFHEFKTMVKSAKIFFEYINMGENKDEKSKSGME